MKLLISSSDTHLLACFSVLLWHFGIFTTWKYFECMRVAVPPGSLADGPTDVTRQELLGASVRSSIP